MLSVKETDQQSRFLLPLLLQSCINNSQASIGVVRRSVRAKNNCTPVAESAGATEKAREGKRIHIKNAFYDVRICLFLVVVGSRQLKSVASIVLCLCICIVGRSYDDVV